MKKFYIPNKIRFLFSLIFAGLWLCLAIWVGYNWFIDLFNIFPAPIAVFIITSLCILPSISSAQWLASLAMDSPRDYKELPEHLPGVTILIAAYNEEEGIYETLEYLNKQEYPGDMIVKVIDNNSTDNTKNEILRAQKDFPNLKLEYMFEPSKGKFNALNKGLYSSDTPYVITLDADTIVYGNGVGILVNHIWQEGKNKNVGAVAGAILVRNSRVNFMTKLQEWEYFLSVNNAKRAQGMWSSCLCTAGAFSVFDTSLVQRLGGWKDSIGEDIVLTWDILASHYLTQYEPEAMTFTNVPTTYAAYFKQRARWGRGMIEALRQGGPWRYPGLITKIYVLEDFLLPILDFGVVLVWIPGIIAALLFHNFIIVGPGFLFMAPWLLLMTTAMFLTEYFRVFRKSERPLKIRKHTLLALIVYMLCFSFYVAPAACWGYIQEIFKAKRKWK